MRPVPVHPHAGPQAPALSDGGQLRPLGASGSVRRLCLLSAAFAAWPAHGDDIVIIVHKENLNAIDLAFVKRVYTGAIKGWPDGSPVFALTQPEDTAAHLAFTTTVLGKTPANLRAIWSQNIFTGKGLPPKVAGADVEMRRLVAANRHAIGYIAGAHVDASVRVIGR